MSIGQKEAWRLICRDRSRPVSFARIPKLLDSHLKTAWLQLQLIADRLLNYIVQVSVMSVMSVFIAELVQQVSFQHERIFSFNMRKSCPSAEVGGQKSSPDLRLGKSLDLQSLETASYEAVVFFRRRDKASEPVGHLAAWASKGGY